MNFFTVISPGLSRIIRQLLKVLTITSFFVFLSFNLSAAPISSFWQVNEQSGRQTKMAGADEALLVANIPIDIVIRELTPVLLSEDSPITDINRFDFDPVNRLVSFEGKAEIPGDILQDLQDAAGGFQLKREHDLKVVFKLPSARQLAVSSFVTIEFVEFKLDGQDYVQSFSILGRFFATMLSHSSFVDYLLDINPDVPMDASDPTNLARQFIERKNIRFRENTVSFRLDLTEFNDFERFRELSSLRLWQFSPVLLAGTEHIVFRIEAGIGNPSERWVTDARARGEKDEMTLTQRREELYQLYGHGPAHTRMLINQVDELLETLGVAPLDDYAKREVEQLKSQLEARARNALGRDNIEFLSMPEVVHHEFNQNAKEHTMSVLSDIKRRIFLRNNQLLNASGESNQPFIVKRLSQNTVNQTARFFRDFDFEGEDLFSQLHIVLAPHLPGVVIRGIINLDFNYLMSIGFEDTDVDLGELPIRLIEDQYGSGVPFEMSLRSHMLNESRLGLDIRTISLFTGSQRISFSKGGRHGDFILNFAKMAIAHSLAATWIDLPGDSDDERDSYEVLREHIKRQEEIYRVLEGRYRDTPLTHALKDIALIDIQNNPFITVGRDFVAGKTELILDELIEYDEEKELLVFDLNPKVISDSIMSSDNTVEVWNVESLVDTEANQTYLELALGDGPRGRTYLEELSERDEYRDGANFSGLSIDESEGADISVSMELESFEKLINSILTDAYISQNLEVEQELKEDKELETYMLQDLSFNISERGNLELSVLMTHIEKKERGALNPARWFGERWPITRRSIGFKAELNMSLEELDKYKDNLTIAENEVFFHDQVLRLDLERIQVSIGGDTSILDRIINLFGSDIDMTSGLSRRIKHIVMWAVGSYFNPTDSDANENVVLGGLRLNQYAKVFAHRDEFLLQLNPHILGKSFEVRLRAPFGKDSFRPVLDSQRNLLRFDFETVGNMANADKNELYRIMRDAERLFSPVLAAQSREELESFLADHQFANQLFRDSDYTKMSLLHRYTHVLSQYDGMISATHPDLSTMAAIQNSINSDLNIGLPTVSSRDITTSGVELMYFLSTAYILKDFMAAYLDKVDELDAHGTPYHEAIVEKYHDIEQRFIIPLMEQYEESFYQRNKTILEKGVTDWNHSFYPDARYSHSVFQLLKELLAETE